MEEWRDIVGFEEIYQVSDQGDVRALDRVMPSGKWGSVRRKGGPMVSKVGRTGRRYIGLRANGERTWKGVHRLVCEAFHGLGPDDEDKVVHFLDNDPLNVRASNLRVASAVERGKDRCTYATKVADAGRYLARLTEDDVREIRRLYRRGRPRQPGNQVELAQRFGVAPAYIQRIANAKAWTRS